MDKDYKKLYEEALERAKYLKENTDSIGAKDISYNFEYIFPELKEPEDERIRKGLIKGLSAMRDIHKHQTFSDDAININDAIAWLEKQGEQKPADKVEPKFEELTEFDYAVLSIVSDHNSHTDSIEAFAKRSSKKLIDLARKELEKDNVIIDKDRYLKICDQYYNNGKKNALKSFPKWKKANVFVSNEFGLATRDDDLIITHNGYQIKLSDLETLPKEE